MTLLIPVMEVVNPTTPAMREKITTNPVAKFPNGKYIGNILAGGCSTDAARNTKKDDQDFVLYDHHDYIHATDDDAKKINGTRLVGPFDPMVDGPCCKGDDDEVEEDIEYQ